MSANAWDAAVIGGGPAGLSAATRLAQKGLRVVLLEAKTYPHDKLCGEFLSPECGLYLSRLGAYKKVIDLQPVAMEKAVITAPDGASWEGRLPGTALGISRRRFDAALAEHAQQAGVQVIEAIEVTGVNGSLKEGFLLETRSRKHSGILAARAVIGAYGRRASLDRFLGRSFLRRRHPYLAFKAYFHGPRIPGRIELHAFPGGYCGMSEIEDGCQVACFLVHERIFQQHRGRQGSDIDFFLRWMRSKNLFLEAWFRWAERIHERWIAVSQIPFTSKPLFDQGILMAGDAAGLIVPLAGNGISMALEGGILAAGRLACFLAGEIDEHELALAYSTAWKRRFWLRLGLGQLLNPLLMDPRRASLALRLLSAAPPLGKFLVAHTR